MFIGYVSESEFEKDDSALQSILNETGIEGIPEAKGPERHTLAGPSASKVSGCWNFV